MFRRMQLHLALVFSLILLVVLTATSAAVYFLLATYNESQILAETNRMIASISETEWTQEIIDEEQHVIDGIPEDAEQSGFEIELDSHSTEDGKNDSLDDSVEDSGGDSLDEQGYNEDDKQEGDEKDNQEEEKNVEDTSHEDRSQEEPSQEEPSQEEPSQEGHSDSDQDEEGGEEKESQDKGEDKEKDEDDSEKEDKDDDIGYGGSPLLALASGPLYNYKPFQSSSEVRENEIHGADGQELIIPKTFDAFSFYFIYDQEGQLLKWKNDFNQWNEVLAEKSKEMEVKDKPEVFRVGEAEQVAFIVQKLPIVVRNETVGYYTVGRDVSIVDQTLDNLFHILILSLGIGIFASAGIGYFIAGRMIKPIKEAYYSKQRFLADASHELRTPISVVLLSCDTLDEGEFIQDDFGKEVVTGIRAETKRMKELVERLLKLARYDAGTVKFSKEPLEMGQILESNKDSYQYIGKRKDIDIQVNREENLMVNGDRQLLNSLISILVDNAIKYNQEGGKVNIRARKRRDRKKKYIEIRIEDTGKGIPEEDLKSIFTRFYRVDKSRGREVEGHGLGLSIAKEVVELHKGKIIVDSQVGKGTIFTLLLPEID